MKKLKESKHLRALCMGMSQIDSGDDVRKFLEDLCTPAELQAMADRLLVAKLLLGGASYRAISEETGVSTATISRVARSLSYGQGGYRSVLKKLEELNCEI